MPNSTEEHERETQRFRRPPRHGFNTESNTGNTCGTHCCVLTSHIVKESPETFSRERATECTDYTDTEKIIRIIRVIRGWILYASLPAVGHFKLNVTVTVVMTSTGSPFNRVGRYFHCFTASSAA